jgi:hypothetical protein
MAAGRRRVAATDVDRAIAELTGRSLLTVSLDGQTIVMHPLVADVIASAWLSAAS